MPIIKKRSDNLLGVKQYYIPIFGSDLFCLSLYEKSGWFRLFGKGLQWKPKDAELIFSERNGKSKSIVVGNWRIKYLP